MRTNGKENQAHYYYKCMTNATHNVAKDKFESSVQLSNVSV